MKTRHRNRAFCASFAAVGLALLAAAALPQAAQAQSQAAAVAVLQSEMADVKAAIIRIDERFERMDQTIVEIKENAVRLDEKMNGLQMQNQFLIIPLLLMILATMFGLLTKGILWGIERAPKSAGAAHRGGGAQPVATPA